jgi:hypothetical protein
LGEEKKFEKKKWQQFCHEVFIRKVKEICTPDVHEQSASHLSIYHPIPACLIVVPKRKT